MTTSRVNRWPVSSWRYPRIPEGITISDLVVTVRQISNYPPAAVAGSGDNLLMQQGGPGAPYASINAADLVQTALQQAGPLGIGVIPPVSGETQVFTNNFVVVPEGALLFNQYWTGTAAAAWQSGFCGGFALDQGTGTFEWDLGAGSAGQPAVLSGAMSLNQAGNLFLPRGTLAVARDPALAGEVATLGWVGRNTVGSFNNRNGQVILNASDVYNALKLCDPIATQPWVQNAINQSIQNLLYTCPFVNTWNGRKGSVYLMLSDITTVFYQSGQQPVSPTPIPTSNDDSIATTKWVTQAFQPDGGTFLPISGGTMQGPLHMAANRFDNLSADGNDSALIVPVWTPCWPVANAPDPVVNGYPAIRSQFVVQAQTQLDDTTAEGTGVFGLYVNTGQPNGQKFALYAGAVQGPQGGTTWSFNTVTVRNGVPAGVPGGPSGVGSGVPGPPGAIPIANGTIGYELDYTNWDQDTPAGGAFAVGMYIHVQSLFPSLSGIYYDSHPLNVGQNNFGWHYGIMFTGPYTIEDAAIFDNSNSNSVIRVSGAHSSVIDVATSPPAISGPMWNGPFSATSIDNTPIGATTPSTGVFTAISAASSGAGPLVSATASNSSAITLEVEGTSQYSIYINDTAQHGITFGGNHSVNNIWVVDNAPVVLSVAGTHTNIIDATAATVTGSAWNGNLSVGGNVSTTNGIIGGFVAVGPGGPTWTAGSAVPTGNQPAGSLYSHTTGATGARLYVSAGGGTWNAVAGV